MLGLDLLADAKCLLQEARVSFEGVAEMSGASVPLVIVILVMAVLVSGVFGSSVLVGDIIWLCFVIASVVHITAIKGWQCVS